MTLWRRFAARWAPRRASPDKPGRDLEVLETAEEPAAQPLNSIAAEPERSEPETSELAPVYEETPADRAATPVAHGDDAATLEDPAPQPLPEPEIASVAEVRDEVPLDLGTRPSDPLVAEVVALNDTSVRLANAIHVAASKGLLPANHLSDYLRLGVEAPFVFKTKVQNLGQKSAEELDALMWRAERQSGAAPPDLRVLAADELKVQLSALFEDASVEEALAPFDPPVRLLNALDRLELLQRPLGDLLKDFPKTEAVLLQLQNLGRKSLIKGRAALSDIIRERLVRQLGLSPEVADWTCALLLDDAQVDPSVRLELTEKLAARKAVGGDAAQIAPDAPVAPAIAPEPRSEPTPAPAELIAQLLAGLSERERDILQRRYGLAGPAETLEEVGQTYHVTRERIRQIEAKTIRRLRQRAQRRLVASLQEHAASIWAALAGAEDFVVEIELAGRRRLIDPAARLAFEIVQLSLDAWLDDVAQSVDGGWVPNSTDLDRVRSLEETLEARLAVSPLPSSLQALAADGQLPELRRALRLKGYVLFGDYVLKERPRPRIRRALGLHALFRAGGARQIAELVAAYHAATPNDRCSLRDAEIVMQMQRHLFLELTEGLWIALGPSGAVPVASPTPADELVDDDDTAALSEADGTIGSAIEAELRRSGPLRISELVERAPQFLPPGRSVNSVGPILITNKDRFARPLPGFYALHDQVPSASAILASAPGFILHEDQVRTYVLARRAGEPFGEFPLWRPETEYQWCRWAKRFAEPALLESLLSIADFDAWPETIEDKAEWKALAAARGRFSIGYPPNLEPVVLPELDRIFAGALFLQDRGGLSWISANRILWRRALDHSGAGLLAVLAALEALAAPDDWQAPHRPAHQLDQFIARAGRARAGRAGRLQWDDEFGRELRQELLNSGWAGQGWVEPDFVRRMLGPGAVEPPPAPPAASALDLLLSERAQSQRAAGLEATLRALSPAAPGDEETA